MVFTKRLREGVRRGEITCSVRFWKVAKHGRSEKIYLVRFHYVRPRGKRVGRKKA